MPYLHPLQRNSDPPTRRSESGRNIGEGGQAKQVIQKLQCSTTEKGSWSSAQSEEGAIEGGSRRRERAGRERVREAMVSSPLMTRRSETTEELTTLTLMDAGSLIASVSGR